jgi:16S rRNA (cytosine967-C5)-methyltransferase
MIDLMTISNEIQAIRLFNAVISNTAKRNSQVTNAKGKTLDYLSSLYRHHIKTEALIKRALAEPNKLPFEVLGLIRLGCFLLQEDPDQAPKIIHRMVECIKPHHKWATGVINASLRKINKNNTIWLKDLTPWQYYSIPLWLYKKITKAYPEKAPSIFNQWLSKPIHTARVRPPLLREQLLSQWLASGVKAHEHPEREDMICIKGTAIKTLPGYTEGSFYIQNASGLDVLEKISAPKNAKLLDMCAAPGGKTIFLADHFPLFDITAVDVDKNRLSRMDENLKRMNMSIKVKNEDAFASEKWNANELYDIIVLDAPCSAIGVISKHPDIKLSRKEEDVSRLAENQLNLLKALWPLLKERGQLVYLVCSILPEEGIDIIETFQKESKCSLEYNKTYLPTTYFHGFFGCILKK